MTTIRPWTTFLTTSYHIDCFRFVTSVSIGKWTASTTTVILESHQANSGSRHGSNPGTLCVNCSVFGSFASSCTSDGVMCLTAMRTIGRNTIRSFWSLFSVLQRRLTSFSYCQIADAQPMSTWGIQNAYSSFLKNQFSALNWLSIDGCLGTALTTIGRNICHWRMARRLIQACA